MEHIVGWRINTLYSGNEPIVGQFPNRFQLKFVQKGPKGIFGGNYVWSVIGTRTLIAEKQYDVVHWSDCWE